MFDYRLGILDLGIGRFFKCPIAGVIEDAVFENEVLAVAEGLGAGDATADKTEIAGVPTEVFALYFRVIDDNVLGLPKGIFGVEYGAAEFDVASVLEDVLSLQLDIGEL